MSGLRIERFDAEPDRLEPFERVRSAVGLYPPGSAEPVTASSKGLVAWRGDAPAARCSAMVAADLHGAPGPSGLVGHYEALDAEAGVAVLRAACAALAARGVARVLGPMNGSTWARYRLALAAPPGDPRPAAPPFLAEPWNPPRYPEDFAAAGFVVEARYESRIDEALGQDAGNAEAVAAAVAEAGLRVRPLDLSRFDRELEALFEISRAAFAENLYYTPIDFAVFRGQYEKSRPLIDPGLVLIAEDRSGAPAGFLFAFVDPFSPPAESRVVVKTGATLPAARGRGLAHHLMDLVRRRARDLRCRSAIHALMHVQNFSMRMSARHQSRVFRRYALYRWEG